MAAIWSLYERRLSQRLGLDETVRSRPNLRRKVSVMSFGERRPVRSKPNAIEKLAGADRNPTGFRHRRVDSLMWMRLYWPKEEALQGEWKKPLLQRVT